MVLQLAVGGSTAVPWTQIGITWQGVGPGDEMSARWSEESGRGEWSGRTALPWIRRDSYRRDEHWQVDLQRVPAGISLISLVLRSSVARSVGVAIVPLNGSPDDAILHPGMRIVADQPTVLMTIRRTGGAGWTASVAAGLVDPENPFPEPEPDRDPGHAQVAVPVPPALESPVRSVRSTGQARKHVRISAIVDISASMRPWLVNGALADTVTAIQAVACASARPAVATVLVPAGHPSDLPVEKPSAEFLSEAVTRYGLRTGNALAVRAQTDDALRRGGVVFVVTDDPLTRPAEDERAITVVLSTGTARADRLLTVGETVDVDGLAADLAIAAASVPGD